MFSNSNFVIKSANKLVVKFFLFLFPFSFLLLSCSSKTKITSVVVSHVNMTDSISEGDAAIASLISPYKKELDLTMNEVLNTSEMAMLNDRPEGILGNFVADLSLKKAHEIDNAVDFCLLNTGGLRTSLPEGEITRGKIFELMPFENELVVITLTGRKTKALFDYLSKVGGQPVAGVKIGIEKDRPEIIYINKVLFDSTKIYKVVTTDYLANGGDKMDFFKEPISRKLLNIKLRDAIIEYVVEEKENGRSINAKFDGRVYYVH